MWCILAMPMPAVVDVPVQCALADGHYGRVLSKEISTTPAADEHEFAPGRFLLQSNDGKLFWLHYDVIKAASPVLAAYAKG